MIIECARVDGRPAIHDVKNDFWKLRDLYENHSIRDFDVEFMRISDSYLDSDFNPDSFFPNKVELNRRLDAVIDNLRTIQLLIKKKELDPSEYADNLAAAIAICVSIEGMKWVKEKPEWNISADEIRITVMDGDICEDN